LYPSWDNFRITKKNMKTILNQSENMGGVVKIWAIPSLDYSIATETLQILNQDNMVEIYIQEDSCALIEDDIAGGAFKTEIVAQVPCDHPDTITIIKQMERVKKYNVILVDGNGNYKLAGSKSVPLRFSAKLTTGATTASLNHYAISFLAKAITTRAVFINNPFQNL